MVLKRLWGDSGKISTLHIHCSGLPGNRAFRVGGLVLYRLILANFHLGGNGGLERTDCFQLST